MLQCYYSVTNLKEKPSIIQTGALVLMPHQGYNETINTVFH